MNGTPSSGGDQSGPLLTFWIAVIGMGVVLIAFVIAVLAFRSAAKPAEVIVAVLGPIATAVGTLAGFVAGAKIGSEGRDKAEDRADIAQQKFSAVVEAGGSSVIDQARAKYPDLFK